MSDHTIVVIRVIKNFLYSSFVYSCHLFLISSFLFGPSSFCPLLCPSLHEMFSWYLQFSWRGLLSFPFYCFPLFLCIVQLRRLCFLSLLFSGTLHSVGYVFPFVLCLSLFFSQLFVRSLQMTILPSCISFSTSWEWLRIFQSSCLEPKKETYSLKSIHRECVLREEEISIF